MNKFDYFLRGMSRLIYPWGYDDDYRRIKQFTNTEALRRDWQAVRDDMRTAIRQYQAELRDIKD